MWGVGSPSKDYLNRSWLCLEDSACPWPWGCDRSGAWSGGWWNCAVTSRAYYLPWLGHLPGSPRLARDLTLWSWQCYFLWGQLLLLSGLEGVRPDPHWQQDMSVFGCLLLP